jgi:hypothetical protein
VTRPRNRALAALAVAALAVAALVGWGLAERFGGEPPHPTTHPEVRHRELVELRRRLIPSSVGGWVAETPLADESLEEWLLAASQEPGPSRSFDEALDRAERRLAGSGDTRALALVLAQVLPGPTADRARADRLAADVLQRTAAALDGGDNPWLAAMIQFSAGRSPSAPAAARWLGTRAGAVGCDRLDGAARDLPRPATSLTIAVRLLAATGAHCDQAPEVLAAALTDPIWETWVATLELTDLAAISDPLPASTRRTLAERLDEFLVVGPERPIDMGAVVAVQSARRRLGLPTRVRAELRHHLDGQVVHRGGLAGRSTSPPTAFDVAILRQLAGEHLVAPRMLADTVAAADDIGAVDGADPGDSVVDDLLASSEPLPCDQAPRRAPARDRVSFVGVAADQAWAVVRAHCTDRLDPAATVARIRTEANDDQRAVRIAVAELAACRLDRDALAEVPGRRLDVRGAFATDSLLVWARAIAADPVAACRAATGS